MIYAKLIDENQVEYCPQNGYIGDNAISNMPLYLELMPNIAKDLGYYPVVRDVPDSDIGSCIAKYSLEDSTIFERYIKNEISEEN